MKRYRYNKIKEIVQSKAIETQEELAADYNIFARKIVMGIQYSANFLKNLMITSRYF